MSIFLGWRLRRESERCRGCLLNRGCDRARICCSCAMYPFQLGDPVSFCLFHFFRFLRLSPFFELFLFLQTPNHTFGHARSQSPRNSACRRAFLRCDDDEVVWMAIAVGLVEYWKRGDEMIWRMVGWYLA